MSGECHGERKKKKRSARARHLKVHHSIGRRGKRGGDGQGTHFDWSRESPSPPPPSPPLRARALSTAAAAAAMAAATAAATAATAAATLKSIELSALLSGVCV